MSTLQQRLEVDKRPLILQVLILQQKYCPPLDSALVAAIGCEIPPEHANVDLEDAERPDVVQQIIDTLDVLASEANKVLDEELESTANDHAESDLPDQVGALRLESTHKDASNAEDGSKVLWSDSATTTTLPSASSIASITDSSQSNETAEMEFLHVSFPNKSADYLTDAFNRSGRDIELAIDTILSEDFLENEAREAKPGSEPLISHPQTHLYDIDSSVNKKKRNRSKTRQVKGVVSLTDVMHTPTGSGRNTPDLDSADNKWVIVNSQIEYLSSLFGIPSSKVMSTYHSCQGNLRAAIFDIIASKQPADNQMPSKEDLEQVSELFVLFPHRDKNLILRILVAVNKITSDAVDLLFKLDELPAEVPIGVDDSSSTARPKIPTAVAAAASLVAETEDADALRDPAACKRIAQEYIIKRDDCYRKAAEAYRRSRSEGNGSRTLGGAALFYSDQGRAFDAKARKWNMMASRGAVRQQSNDPTLISQGGHTQRGGSSNVIDLHGLSVTEALTIAREETNAWYARSMTQAQGGHGNGALFANGFVIITGSGLHSKGGNARLRPAVAKGLEKDGWRVSISDGGGAIIVHGVAGK